MTEPQTRPIPLLGDISLAYVQRIEHELDSGFVPLRIAGLAGELLQRSGRASHRIRVAGELFGETAADDLAKLQAAAAAGEELTFASDITTALELQNVVIESIAADQVAGHPGRFRYEVTIAESPPLPAPAQLEAFGGLDEFGLGDLGFDTDLLDELGDLAGDIAGAVDGALAALDALQALAALDGLQLGGLLAPLAGQVDSLAGVGSGLGDAGRRTREQLAREEET